MKTNNGQKLHMFQVTVIITTIYYSLVGREILYEERIQKRLSKELITFINNVKENHYTIEFH